MRDEIESREAAAEDRYFDTTAGLPVGQMRCGCGEVFDEHEGQPLGPSPWSLPSCPACVRKWETSRPPIGGDTP